MMTSKNSSGTMILPSLTAVALWVNEICGQISDGMWENSTPHDHWNFWCNLDVKVGPCAELKKSPGRWAVKRAYALTRLHQAKYDDGTYVLRDRMLAAARMAIAGADPTDCETCGAGEHMPATLAEFRAAKAANKWDHDFIAKHMDNVSDDLAVKFYDATYTMKEMNADLKLIMKVMHAA